MQAHKYLSHNTFDCICQLVLHFRVGLWLQLQVIPTYIFCVSVYVFIVDNQDVTELQYVTQDLVIPAKAAVGIWVGYPWASQIELDACN